MELQWEDLVMPCPECNVAEEGDACQSSVAMGNPAYCNRCNEQRFVPTETGKVLKKYIRLLETNKDFGVNKRGTQED
jgi:hypothetical protein